MTNSSPRLSRGDSANVDRITGIHPNGYFYKYYRDNDTQGTTKMGYTYIAMFRRCYDSLTHDIKPTYKECLVADEWFDFQSFCQWASENGFNRNSSLDKDSIIKGNKKYSPKTCSLLTMSENSKEANLRTKTKTYILTSPGGTEIPVRNLTAYCKKHGLYRVRLNKIANHGYYQNRPFSPRHYNYKGWLCRHAQIKN
ncbi:MAG: hypothetical protein V3V84_07750 [Candidatus Bathyarchaeia archaeon]